MSDIMPRLIERFQNAAQAEPSRPDIAMLRSLLDGFANDFCMIGNMRCDHMKQAIDAQAARIASLTLVADAARIYLNNSSVTAYERMRQKEGLDSALRNLDARSKQ